MLKFVAAGAVVVTVCLGCVVPSARADVAAPPLIIVPCNQTPTTITDATGSETTTPVVLYVLYQSCVNQCKTCATDVVPDEDCPGVGNDTDENDDTKTQTDNFSLSLGALFKLITGSLSKNTTESQVVKHTWSVKQVDLKAPGDKATFLYVARVSMSEAETRTDGKTGGARTEQGVDAVWTTAQKSVGAMQAWNPCTNQTSGPGCQF